MARKIMLKESELHSLIARLVLEAEDAQASAVMAPLEKEESWGKLRQYLKELYTNYKQEFADVQPNEFNEIEMVIQAVISLAREKNINNKAPSVITQYLKTHVRPIEKMDTTDDKQSPDGVKKAPELKLAGSLKEVRRREYNRRYNRLRK
tara:strand:+ start:165 stop:614 length:450 start_codon:yes stop_codon:yes gene_type:complete